VRIALTADTHLPRGRRRVPDECVAALRESDLILHGGDFSTVDVLVWLEALGPTVRAVHGNIDSAEVRARLPDTDVIAAAGRRIGLIHDAGPAKGRLARMRQRFPEADAVVFGHSHLPLHEAERGFQIFNPGSPTERRRAPRHSFGLAEAGPGGLRFEHVWLG
jgi:putative phosphoesterase